MMRLIRWLCEVFEQTREDWRAIKAIQEELRDKTFDTEW